MAYNQMQRASDELKFLLGLSEEDRLLSPSDSVFSAPVLPDSSSTDVSPGSHPDLQIMHLHQQAANNRIGMKRSAWLPRVNGFVHRDWHAAGPFQDDSNDWTAGVQLSWNLFDGLGNWGRKKQAAADASFAEVRYLQTAQKIRNDIDEARRNTTTAHKRIAVARLAVTQAKEGLNLTKERFDSGLAKLSDLLERETLLTRARLRLLKAQHDYSLSISELHFKLGKEYQEIQN
jgi:outer membrane protein TolC